MEEQVILVTHQDKEIGTMEKVEAHREGRLHRAFSVLIFNAWGELLLQKRADTKYHCGGIWTNACDGHPRPDETIVNAAQRRLREELGFSCPLEEVLQFTYQAELDHGLQEHEVDHLLVGHFDGIPTPDPAEVSEVKWIGWDVLEQNVRDNPEQYAVWSKIAFTYRTTIEAALAALNGA